MESTSLKLKLNGIAIDCIIGDRPDERTREQKLRVDVELEISDRAAETDELGDTVDYAELTEKIRAALVSARCRMIERAAKVVYGVCRAEPMVRAATVSVTKVGAACGLESASVVCGGIRKCRTALVALAAAMVSALTWAAAELPRPAAADGFDAAEVSARYERELYERVIPFWVDHSIDRECGGYLTCLDREGRVYDTFKDMWLEWREVYMFAALNNRGRRNAQWVALARHGYDFLYAKGRQTDGTYVTTMNRDGSKTTTAAPLTAIFTHGFAAMACAELYRATGEVKFRDEALSCWRHYRRIWAANEGEWRQLSYRVIGLNVLNVFNCCFRGEFAAEAKAIAAELPRFVEPKTGLMCERLRSDGTHDFSSQYGRFVNSGHTIEAMSFLFDHIAITGDRTLLAFGANLAFKMFDFGWDAEQGGGFVYRDALGLPCDKTDWMLKTWWADCEAATAMLRGWKLTGDPRFLTCFRQIDAYDWQTFRDPDYPEWFAYAPVDGRRCHTYKGNVRKGCFHLPRRLLDCLELLQQPKEE